MADLLLHRADALPRDLAGRTVVITAGGTREPLDPVRFLGNNSSGRQGFALAAVAAARGARVRLVAANVDLPVPAGVEVERVGSAEQLQVATTKAAADADVVAMVAAVADFRPAQRAEHKIKKGAGEPDSIALVRNPDILAGMVAERAGSRPLLVGFAAETGDASGDPLASRPAQAALTRDATSWWSTGWVTSTPSAGPTTRPSSSAATAPRPRCRSDPRQFWLRRCGTWSHPDWDNEAVSRMCRIRAGRDPAVTMPC